MKLRPPATPIINIDPYFSIWTEDSLLKNTVHWTGKPNTMAGIAIVDGEQFLFLGQSNSKTMKTMTVESTEIDAFSTFITYINEYIRLSVRFTSPLLIDDLYYASRPIAYCKISCESLDEKAHNVKIRFNATEELALNLKGEGRALAHPVSLPGIVDNTGIPGNTGITGIKMGNGNQRPLWRDGDDIRIDWGYFYMCAVGEARIDHTLYCGMYTAVIEKEIDGEGLFLFAYDDIESIQYFGDNLKAYWKKDGKTIEEAIIEAASEYEEVLSRCNELSDKIKNDAIEKGSEKYAEMLLLAVRQVMAAHKLVVDKEGNNLYISKECFSNGCAATVDVTYPSAPMYLLYNTELLKGMLRPIMRYAASDEWTFDFAPHDAGRYPLVNGQRYYVTREPGGKVFIDPNGQMPVEECGNMIILFAAICDADNDTSFVLPYMDTIQKWSKYLIEYGFDPETQLCTDDFAGHLAHNVNLSIKAIMGIAGYSRILSRIGETEEAEKMMNTAREYGASLVKRAANSDGSFRLAYDKPETFSLKYNSVWDKLWNTNIFPESFYEGEITRYKKELLPYGVPLDSREKYTKSDWLVWAASLASSKEDFESLTDPLWAAYNTMRTYAPMTDWYFCDTSHMRGFRHRTVQGGLFIKLMF